MQYEYKTLMINHAAKEVYELGSMTPTTTLNELGREGWKLVGCEYTETKSACGGELKSSAIWIAIREVPQL